MIIKSYLISESSYKIAHFPIFCMFCIFPFISIYAKLAHNTMINYDSFWIVLFAYIGIASGFRINREYKTMLYTLFVLILLKYVVPFLTESIVIKAWIMDMKWLVYALTAIFWVSKYGLPEKQFIYDGSLFFAKIYIVFTLFRYIILNEDISRDGILMEANYDGFMILMGFCLINDLNTSKRDFIIFSLATLCTMSRTGLLALTIITLYKYMKMNVRYLIIAVPLLYFSIEYSMSLRGSDSAGHMDRFVYFEQVFLYFSNTGILNVLFGSTPGKPLEMYVLPEFSWTVETFEEMHSLTGVFPFMFHSVYLRLALTWGLPIALCYLLYFIYKFRRSRNEDMKVFCILVLIQSFSLSTLTIQNVSFLFFIVLLCFLDKDRKIYSCV